MTKSAQPFAGGQGNGQTKIKIHARTIAAAAAMATAALIAVAPTAAAADTALILGGSGIPTPPQSYVGAVTNLYLAPNGYGAYTPVPLTTPEQLYPVTGVNSLSADTSVAQGVTILDTAIRQQIAAGNNVVVFGYSQGADVASQEAANLASSPNPPKPGQVSFVLVGNESNPNGGITTRFEIPGTTLALPSLGTTFNFAPTAGTPYPTAVYTQEYDGFADFPQYPLNIVSDLNAYVGVLTQHFGYSNLTPQQISSAVQLPTTGGNTSYYMIPTPNLPLLAPVRLLPLVGNPIADLVQPDLKVLVNLGYGSINNGWSPGPANVVTPIGLLPTNINPTDLVTALANGIPQGITSAVNDLKSPQLLDLSPLSLTLAGLNTLGLTPSTTPTLLQLLGGFAILTNVGNTGGTVTPANFGSSLLTLPKPLADTVTALVVSLPQYDAQLFTNQLAAGNVVNAVGLPIAADIGVAPYALLVGGIFPVIGALTTTVTQAAQLVGLAPNPLAAPVTATPVAAATTASTNAQPAVSTNAGANAANAPNSVQSVVNTAVSSVTTPVRTAISSLTTPVRTALTAGSKPVTAAVSKPTTPAAVTSTPTVKPAAGHGKKH